MQNMEMGFNAADIAVAAIIVICVAASAQKGLIRSLIGVGSNIIALILSRFLYPVVTKAMLGTAFYDRLKLQVMDRLNIGDILSSRTQKFEADMINSLSLPQMFKTGLLENNNSEVYSILNVSGIEDYIGGYIAMIIINIVCVIVVYLAVGFILRFAFKALNVFSRLPVIRTANKLGGAALGFCWAVILIWLIMAFVTLFLTQPKFAYISQSIATSMIAIKFYETDIILNMINKIIL